MAGVLGSPYPLCHWFKIERSWIQVQVILRAQCENELLTSSLAPIALTSLTLRRLVK